MKTRFALGTILILASTVSFAQNVAVDKYVLDNGLTVILHEDHSLPIVTVNIWYHVGSKDEPDRRSGFAHLFEHLMFMGTDRVPTGQYDKIMEGGGGSNNASTTEDRTNFFDIGPSNLLPTLLWLEADRLEDLGKSMTQKKLDLQRDVVKNERRQNTENRPYGKAYEALNSLMYPAGHPYHTSVIGSMDDLDNAGVKDVQDFFATYYVPNNASMVVEGDFNPAEIKPLIAKLFGTLPRRNDVKRKVVPGLTYKGIRRMTMIDQVDAAKTIMAWRSPAEYQAGDAEMNLAASILSSGLNSRLYDRLVVKDKLASDVSANQNGEYLGGYFSIDATLAPGASQDKLEQAIDDEISRFVKSGPTSEEVKRQAASLEYQTLSGLETIDQEADKLNEYEFFFGDPNSFRRVLDTYRTAANPSRIRDAAKAVFDPNNRLILRVVPQSEPAQGPNPRDARPAIPAAAAFQPQEPAEMSLSNGIKVFYWHKPELPLMSLGIQFNVGADGDPLAKVGDARLTADMMTEGGAGNLDAKSFAKALDLTGANLSIFVSHQSSTARLSSTATNFDKALGLLSDAVIRPRFDPKEFERVQRLTITNLEQENEDAETVAGKVEAREFWGADHPYGQHLPGSPESVKALSIADLKADETRIFQPGNATMFVAGSMSQADVKATLERAFGNWRGSGTAAAPVVYRPPANKKLRLLVVDKPGAVQTVIRFIFPGTTVDDPNRIKKDALGLILGGSFTSRLNQNLREDKGYTYGASAGFTQIKGIGFLSAGADVRADVTGASLKEFLKEFAKIRTGDVTEAEAAKADSSLRSGSIQALAGLDGLVSQAIEYNALGFPFSEIGSELNAYGKITAADINAIADKSIPLDSALIVLVGDKAQILKQLDGLGLPPPIEVKP